MTDPHYDEWIQVARVAARLDQWEVVLRLYYHSFWRYQTNTTNLFLVSRYTSWHMANRETHDRIADETKREYDEECGR